MIITAKYPSRCATCHAAIAVGSKIEWSKGNPARHAACSASAAGATSASPALRPTRSYARIGGRCRGCGGEIRDAAHHRAMHGYCGSCAFDEFDC